MDISILEAKDKLPELIEAVEGGEEIILTRHGKPVAQITAATPPLRRPIQWGAMRDRIHLPAGWDAPVELS